jgi:Flp pilus assembly protein TadG
MIAFIGSLTTNAREQVRRRLVHLRRSEDGQAMIELALALPILLMLLLGIVDFGRAVNYWNDENYLANIGARYAAVGVISDTNSPCHGSSAALVAYIQCEAGQDAGTLQAPNGVSAGQPGVVHGISVCVATPGSDVAGTPITVRVSATYDTLPFLHGVGVNPTLNLTGTATMRVEQPASAGGLDITTGSTGSC